MKNSCISYEAKNFENQLNKVGITYNEFVNLQKLWNELTSSGKAEVDNFLKIN